ncbi:hypothetical protein BGZ74_003944 [Mortierella antarctica]|nr:hypothetical protein BGZ74_003944 [Mortierella antarctica]
MCPYFAYSSNPGCCYRQHQPTQFQFQPDVSFDYDSFTPSSCPMFFAQSQLNDDTDEEGQLLHAALEHKRQEKQAHQQYHHQLQFEQQHQYAALMLREQQYQQEQQAITQAKYEAEQEAIHQARAITAHQAQQRQVIAFVQEKPSSDEEAEGEALGALFQHLLSPLAKCTLMQEQSYPCKHCQQCEHKEVKHAQATAATEKEKEAKAKEAKAKEAQKKQDQAQASLSKHDQDIAYIDLSTLLEAMFGVPVQISSSPSSSGCACFTKTANPSTSDSLPKLHASNVLHQHQQCQQQQCQTLQQKHSELNLIESALDELSRELTHSLSIYEETDEVKCQAVLATEENVTKAMFKIDSVKSEGNLSELIKKSQDLLKTIDEYKKESNTGKQVAKNADESASGLSESKSPAPEVEETSELTVESDTAESVDLDKEIQAEEVEEEEEYVQPYVVSDTVPQEKDETAAEAESASVSHSVLVEESVEVTEETPVKNTPKAKATEPTDDDDVVVV